MRIEIPFRHALLASGCAVRGSRKKEEDRAPCLSRGFGMRWDYALHPHARSVPLYPFDLVRMSLAFPVQTLPADALDVQTKLCCQPLHFATHAHGIIEG